jgi:type II secretory ATPase GspE/PulE/Tfp pilus assembly ATPase PilB-like protein
LTATLKQFGSRICAKLTLRAEELLADLVAVRLLLPLRNFTLKLSRLQLPPAVLACVPESVAYENCTLPLHVSSQSVVLAMSYTQRDLCHELGFILNRAVEPVLAPAAQLQAAIVRHYGSAEYQFVDAVLLDYAPTYRELPPRTPYPIDGGTSINRLINTLLSEAIRIRATALELEPFATETGSGVHLWHHIDGWRIEDAPFPVWLLPRIAFRMRVLADIPIREGEVDIGQIPCSYHGTRYRLPVRINPTQHGPHIHIDIPSVSPNPAASARVPTA